MAPKTAVRKAPKKKTNEEPIKESLDPIAPAEMPEENAEQANAAFDHEPDLTGSDVPMGEPKEREPRADVALIHANEHGELDKLPSHQQYFETPDGRLYVGPADQHSIPDPENPKSEINPMRRGGINR